MAWGLLSDVINTCAAGDRSDRAMDDRSRGRKKEWSVQPVNERASARTRQTDGLRRLFASVEDYSFTCG
jgi:hypothetical protein